MKGLFGFVFAITLILTGVIFYQQEQIKDQKYEIADLKRTMQNMVKDHEEELTYAYQKGVADRNLTCQQEIKVAEQKGYNNGYAESTRDHQSKIRQAYKDGYEEGKITTQQRMSLRNQFNYRNKQTHPQQNIEHKEEEGYFSLKGTFPSNPQINRNVFIILMICLSPFLSAFVLGLLRRRRPF